MARVKLTVEQAVLIAEAYRDCRGDKVKMAEQVRSRLSGFPVEGEKIVGIVGKLHLKTPVSILKNGGISDVEAVDWGKFMPEETRREIGVIEGIDRTLFGGLLERMNPGCVYKGGSRVVEFERDPLTGKPVPPKIVDFR